MTGQLPLIPGLALAGPPERPQRPPSGATHPTHGPGAQPTPAAPQHDQAGILAPGARVLRCGNLTVTRCEDGRVLLTMHTLRGDGWLELRPVDLAWLAGALAAAAAKPEKT